MRTVEGVRWRTLNLLMVFQLLLLMIVFPAVAQGIKERMRERLPVLQDLKMRGIVGENNQGYLVFLKDKEKAEVVAAENADRGQIYGAIAKQTGTRIEVVEKQRAIQIAQQSGPGVRIQGPDGTWYTK